MAVTRANGAAIRVIRERSELSVSELVAELHRDGVEIHPDYFRNIELGHKQPSAKLLGAIARALKVPKHAIMATPDDPEPASAQRSAA